MYICNHGFKSKYKNTYGSSNTYVDKKRGEGHQNWVKFGPRSYWMSPLPLCLINHKHIVHSLLLFSPIFCYRKFPSSTKSKQTQNFSYFDKNWTKKEWAVWIIELLSKNIFELDLHLQEISQNLLESMFVLKKEFFQIFQKIQSGSSLQKTNLSSILEMAKDGPLAVWEAQYIY